MSFTVKRHGDTFDVYDGERLFTSCVYEKEYIRPFMGPVYATNGESFTRFTPFHPEHPHQRSVFIGIGDVNGVDCWNEEGENKGKMILSDVLQTEDGETATVSVRLAWRAVDTDEPLVDEIRTLKFAHVENGIAVSVHLQFIASYGDVTFGQTKEAGPLGIRVADVLRADREGVFVNSEGGVNEDACWGKDAKWCNYMGRLAGKTVGIAAFDCGTNSHYPTAWHVRNYGLLAANNLLFKSAEHIPQGETMRYDYTICFWEDAFDPKQIMNAQK